MYACVPVGRGTHIEDSSSNRSPRAKRGAPDPNRPTGLRGLIPSFQFRLDPRDLKEIFHDRVLLGAIIGSVVVNLAVLAYLISMQTGLPELMPLHYNGAGVVDMIGRPSELYKLPAIAGLILLGNVFLASVLYRSERPAAHILIWTGAIVQCVFGTGAWVLVVKAAGE